MNLSAKRRKLRRSSNPLLSMPRDIWDIIAQYLCCHDMAHVRVATCSEPFVPFTGECRFSTKERLSSRLCVAHGRGLVMRISMYGVIHPWHFMPHVYDGDLWPGVRVLHIDAHCNADVDVRRAPELTELVVWYTNTYRFDKRCRHDIRVGPSVRRLTVTAYPWPEKVVLYLTPTLEYLHVDTICVSAVCGSADGLTQLVRNDSEFVPEGCSKVLPRVLRF